MLLTGSEICGLPIALVLLLALIVDAVFGDLPKLFAVVPHPIALVGRAIAFFEHRLNRPGRGRRVLVARGLLVTVLLCGSAAALGLYLAGLFRNLPCAIWLEGLVVALLLAQRGLFDHVRAVGRALVKGGLNPGREAVGHIVGRDPQTLDRHGVARAAIESLAENFSDGVVAPALFYLLFGLPGLFFYKTLNTLDSMIGHRNDRYENFGKFAARFDDLANLIPARLAAFLIAAASIFAPGGQPARTFMVMLRDSGKSKSPNAGWPEAAMAGAVGVALHGPRNYHGKLLRAPWIGEQFPARATPRHIRRALDFFVIACFLLFAIIALVAWRGFTA